MRGLEKNCMGRGHSTDRQTDRQTDEQTDRRTCRLSDQLGTEGRVGENILLSFFIILLPFIVYSALLYICKQIPPIPLNPPLHLRLISMI